MTHDTPPKRIWEDRMTDLTRERIEEIKKWKSLFDRGEVVNFLSVGETHDLARQLLATMTALAEVQKREAGLREALTEAVEIVHKSYVAATMGAVNAGPSHPIKDKYDAWRVRCMNAETKARAALSAAPTGEESNG